MQETKIIGSSIENYSPNVGLLIVTLMEEAKPVVTKKIEF